MLKVTRSQLEEAVGKALTKADVPEDKHERITEKVCEEVEQRSIENDASWQGARE